MREDDYVTQPTMQANLEMLILARLRLWLLRRCWHRGLQGRRALSALGLLGHILSELLRNRNWLVNVLVRVIANAAPAPGIVARQGTGAPGRGIASPGIVRGAWVG